MINWKFITDLSVPGIDANRYMISNIGTVYDTKSDRYPNIIVDDEGYHRVYLNTIHGFKLVYIHRIVITEWKGISPFIEYDQVDHIDCDKSHNFPENLDWVTRQENSLRAIKNGLYTQFDVKITEEDAELICRYLKSGKSYDYISDILYPKYNQRLNGIIGKIYRGERWKHISRKYLPFPELEKEQVIPSNSKLNKDIVNKICSYLDLGHGITETARLIESEYNIDTDLENAIGFIKRGRTWKSISKDYNFMKMKGEIISG